MTYSRYESPELQEWKKISQEEQMTKLKKISKPFSDILQVVYVKDQSIRVNILVEKSEYYDSLVKYETYIREELGNIPVIVLVQEKLDENKRRQ